MVTWRLGSGEGVECFSRLDHSQARLLCSHSESLRSSMLQPLPPSPSLPGFQAGHHKAETHVSRTETRTFFGFFFPFPDNVFVRVSNFLSFFRGLVGWMVGLGGLLIGSCCGYDVCDSSKKRGSDFLGLESSVGCLWCVKKIMMIHISIWCKNKQTKMHNIH